MFSNALRKFSYHRHIEAARVDHIVLVSGKDTDGHPVWFYLMVDFGKLKAFQTNQGIALLNLTDYGRILYSGMGDMPPEIIRWQMEREYGFVS